MAGELIVIVTCPKDSAEKIASLLVEEQLAACVNIVPNITSVFYWQEKLCQEQESLLVIKSHKSKWSSLEERIKVLHSYEVPEIIAITIDHGYPPYLNWLQRAINVHE